MEKEEFNELIDLKKHIFKILGVKNLNDAKNLQNHYWIKNIHKITLQSKSWINLSYLTFKLMVRLENTNIPSTNNKIENIF